MQACPPGLSGIVSVRLADFGLINSRSSSYGYGRSPFSTFINVSDLFFYWDPYYSRRRAVYRQNPGEMNFFESVFSFGELLPESLPCLTKKIQCFTLGIMES